MRQNIEKPRYDFTLNPNKRTQHEEDTAKVQFQHLELSFQVFLFVLLPILSLTFLAELGRYRFVKKWKVTHGKW